MIWKRAAISNSELLLWAWALSSVLSLDSLGCTKYQKSFEEVHFHVSITQYHSTIICTLVSYKWYWKYCPVFALPLHTKSGALSGQVPQVHPNPLKFDNACTAPVLGKYILLLLKMVNFKKSIKLYLALACVNPDSSNMWSTKNGINQ